MHQILFAVLTWAAANPDQAVAVVAGMGTMIGGGFVAMAKHTKNTVDDKVAAKLVEIGHAIHPAVAEAVPVLLQAKSAEELKTAGAAVAAKVAADAGIPAGVVAAAEQVASAALKPAV